MTKTLLRRSGDTPYTQSQYFSNQAGTDAVYLGSNGNARHISRDEFAADTHATDESKRRAVENLVKPIGPSDESVTNEKGRVAALPEVIDSIGGAEGGRTPDLRIANAALCQTELLPHAECHIRKRCQWCQGSILVVDFLPINQLRLVVNQSLKRPQLHRHAAPVVRGHEL
jgi:hypothetical protein